MEQTLGELRIRTTFNPDNNTVVDNIKQRAASFINYVNEIAPNPHNGESARLKALALTAIEEASMWAVKLATF